MVCGDRKVVRVQLGSFTKVASRKFHEGPTRRSDFVDGPNSAGPHYTFST